MNCIQLTKKYRVRSYVHGWILERYEGVDKKTGKQKWVPFKYASNLTDIARYATEQLFRESDATTLEELKKAAVSARIAVESVLL